MSDQFFDQYQDDALPDEQPSFGDWVDLPFPYLRLNWWNGDKRLGTADKTSVQAFGGWYCAADKFMPVVDAIGKGAPDCFSVAGFDTRDGGTFEANQARLIYVSYITHRKAWFPKENGSNQSRLEVLTLLGEFDKSAKHFVAWGPAVLVGTGYTSKFIEDAIHTWFSSTAAARREFAKNMGAQNFFFPIGTYADTIETKTVGKSQTSPVTPPKLKEPAKQDYDLFKMIFIGHDREVLRTVKEYKSLAQDWIDDFSIQAERSKSGETAQATSGERKAAYNPTPQDDDDIPF